MSLIKIYEYLAVFQTVIIFLFCFYFIFIYKKIWRNNLIYILVYYGLIFLLDIISWYQYYISNAFPFNVTPYYSLTAIIFVNLYFSRALLIPEGYIIIFILCFLNLLIFYSKSFNQYSILGNTYHFATLIICCLLVIFLNIKNQKINNTLNYIALTYLVAYCISFFFELSFIWFKKMTEPTYYSIQIIKNLVWTIHPIVIAAIILNQFEIEKKYS